MRSLEERGRAHEAKAHGCYFDDQVRNGGETYIGIADSVIDKGHVSFVAYIQRLSGGGVLLRRSIRLDLLTYCPPCFI